MSERTENSDSTSEYDALIDAATAYLRSIGAHVVVIGGSGILGADLPLNHYLTVKWTGTLPKEKPDA